MEGNSSDGITGEIDVEEELARWRCLSLEEDQVEDDCKEKLLEVCDKERDAWRG